MIVEEKQLYDIQRDFIAKAREIIKHRRIGIFSSPTGTGKTISLLMSLKEFVKDNAGDLDDDGLFNELFGTSTKRRVFYVSRTHSQLGQVIEELKNVFECKAVVLGSRKLYCINESVRNSDIEALNLQCASLTKRGECEYHVNYEGLLNQGEVQKPSSDFIEGFSSALKAARNNKSTGYRKVNNLFSSGCNKKPLKKEDPLSIVESGCKSANRITAHPVRIHDIENFVSSCALNRVCPYFLSRKYAESCELLFMPYNLLFSKEGRRSLGIVLDDSIIVVDEAHNLVDTILQMNTAVVSQFFLSHFKRALTDYQVSLNLQGNTQNNLLGKLLEILEEFEDFFKVAAENELACSKKQLENEITYKHSGIPSHHTLEAASSSYSSEKASQCNRNIQTASSKYVESFSQQFKKFSGKKMKEGIVDHCSEKKWHSGVMNLTKNFSKDKNTSNKEMKDHLGEKPLLQKESEGKYCQNYNSKQGSRNNISVKKFCTAKFTTENFEGVSKVSLKNDIVDISKRITKEGLKSLSNEFHQKNIECLSKDILQDYSQKRNQEFPFFLSADKLQIKIPDIQQPCDSERVVTASNFLAQTGIYNYDLSAICEYMRKSKLVHKIRMSDKISEFYVFVKFLELLNEADSSGRVFFNSNMLRFTPLNAQPYFEDILQCQSLILAGGTMEPIEDLARLLYREDGHSGVNLENNSQSIQNGMIVDTSRCKSLSSENKKCKSVPSLENQTVKKFNILHTNSIIHSKDSPFKKDVSHSQPLLEIVSLQNEQRTSFADKSLDSSDLSDILELSDHETNYHLSPAQPKVQSNPISFSTLKTQPLFTHSSLDNLKKNKLSQPHNPFPQNTYVNNIATSRLFHNGLLEYHAYAHVCTNFCAQIVTKGPSKLPLVLTHKSKNNEAVIKEYLQALLNYTKLVKTGGIVCFLPSSAYINIIQANLPESLQKYTLYDSQCTFEQYKEELKHNEKVILFSVMGGKLSEGINFSDNLCRLLVIFGIPFPTQSLELAEREKFHLSTGSKHDFQTTIAMKTVNQAIGRAIRHKDDFSGILLLDARYVQIKHLLSSWIASHLSVAAFQESMHNLINFYSNNKDLRND